MQKNNKKLQKAIENLEKIYDDIPDTVGCMKWISTPKSEGGCGAWCCLLPDEIVYCEDGPKKIKDVNPGCRVFTKGGIKTVTASASRLVNEDVLEVTTRYGRTIKLTKDHPIYCDLVPSMGREDRSFQFVEAQDIYFGDNKRDYQHYVYLPKIEKQRQSSIGLAFINLVDFLDVFLDPITNKVYSTYRKRGKPFSSIILFDDDWAWILGMYLAEGSCKDNVVSFQIHGEKKSVERRIRLFGDKIHCRVVSKNNSKNGKTIQIFSPVLSKFMNFFGGDACHRKMVNDYLLPIIINKDYLVSNLLDGYYAGNGSETISNYFVTTTSKEMAEQILFFNLLDGRLCGISVNNTEDKKEIYCCYSNKAVKYNEFIETDNYFMLPIDKVRTLPYTGPVYDIEVEDEHSFATSFGEVHNCKFQSPQVLYVEFLRSWKNVLDNWSEEDIIDLIDKAIRNYLSDVPTKGCIFWDKETKLCRQHKHRPYNCFLPHTWVYTTCGPKVISQVLAGDFILGPDGLFHKVSTTVSRTHKGYIYDVKPQGTNISCWSTGDHLWLTAYQKDKRKNPETSWTEARRLVGKKGKKYGNYIHTPLDFDLAKGSHVIDASLFVKSRQINGERLENHTSSTSYGEPANIPRYFEINKDFLFMIGIYLAEGDSSNNGGSTFSMHQDEKPYLDRISNYLNSMNIRNDYLKQQPGKKTLTLRVAGILFGRFMKKMCGRLSTSKHINEEVFSILSAEQLDCIFDAWVIGDGVSNSTEGLVSATSTSELLVMQMKMIAEANGRFARIYCEKRNDRPNKSYQLQHFTGDSGIDARIGQGLKNMRLENDLLIPLQEVDKKHYEGPVIDIEVEDVSSFVTSSGTAHNCHIYGITPEEEFKPRYERLKVLYQNRIDATIRDQCNLIETEDGTKVTKSMTDDWWKRLVEVEESIGIDKSDMHDDKGGSYLTFHDHLLLQICDDTIMNQLQTLRLHGTKIEKEIAVKGLIEGFRTKINSFIERSRKPLPLR